MVMDQTIGVLSLYSATPRQFSEDEISFLAALAEHGGMAIQNARLIERLNRNSRLFFDLASAVNSSLDIKQILHILTAEVADALGLKGVAIRLLNKDAGTLDLMASYGLSEEFLNKGPVSVEQSVERCLKGETIFLRTEERAQYQEETRKEGIAAMLCVPIRVGDEVIGLMRLFSEHDQGCPEDVVNLVNALAHQGGLAIQNASMYLMLQEDKKSLEQDIWSHKTWF